MSSQLASNMKKTSDAFLAAFDSWTTEAVMAVRATECEHIMLPASLGVPKKNNDEFREHFEQVEGSLSNVKVRTHAFLRTYDIFSAC